MRWGSFLLVALAYLVMPSISNASGDYSPTEIRQIAYRYGKCIVRGHARSASQAILGDEDNREIVKDHADLLDGDCLLESAPDGEQMQFPGDLYGYALADGLFLKEFAAAPVIDPSKVPHLGRRTLPEPPAALAPNASGAAKRKYVEAMKAYDDARALRQVGEYGECVVRADPAGAKALLLTVPDSAEEKAAFTTITPALGACLSAGAVLTFGKSVLRGTIAVNYYRLARASAPVSGLPPHW